MGLVMKPAYSFYDSSPILPYYSICIQATLFSNFVLFFISFGIVRTFHNFQDSRIRDSFLFKFFK